MNKLLQRKFALDAIKITLDALITEGLLNEARFVENYIHYRKQKGYGPIKISAELIERGVKENFIDSYLNASNKEWIQLGKKVWEKKFKNQLSNDLKVKNQQMRFLYQRGFTNEQIKIILKCEDHVS